MVKHYSFKRKSQPVIGFYSADQFFSQQEEVGGQLFLPDFSVEMEMIPASNDLFLFPQNDSLPRTVYTSPLYSCSAVVYFFYDFNCELEKIYFLHAPSGNVHQDLMPSKLTPVDYQGHIKVLIASPFGRDDVGLRADVERFETDGIDTDNIMVYHGNTGFVFGVNELGHVGSCAGTYNKFVEKKLRKALEKLVGQAIDAYESQTIFNTKGSHLTLFPPMKYIKARGHEVKQSLNSFRYYDEFVQALCGVLLATKKPSPLTFEAHLMNEIDQFLTEAGYADEGQLSVQDRLNKLKTHLFENFEAFQAFDWENASQPKLTHL